MADGYARVSGKPGVCFIITGPGLTNIATAMAQAYGLHAEHLQSAGDLINALERAVSTGKPALIQIEERLDSPGLDRT